jgi:membrane-associated protease RseP (regulator of RpoE activity)
MDKTPTVQNTKYGSPAFRAGLYPGDRLLELDGKKIESIEHLKSMVQRLETLEVPISFQRGEHTFTTPLRLDADRKIGASFTEGISDVTEVWVKEGQKPTKKTEAELSSNFTNPFPKNSDWVTLFRNVGWLSLLGLALSLLTRIFTEIPVPRDLLYIFAFFFMLNTFFAHQLQISNDMRWMSGETHKALKESKKAE